MKYRTVSGDTFDKIAYDHYKDEKFAIHIMEANIIYANVLVFNAGVDLIIPDIDVTPTSNLPPWKRGSE
ncbi:tail protein X [Virgibacillus halodenitrificans]|uniref:tail protein X n=1 Tax=Virgibacillus halodenitrificans TaxID=1482 RepID=UPI000EF50BC5|nr:tail protein X [Virgibacillus halodenitrificans]